MLIRIIDKVLIILFSILLYSVMFEKGIEQRMVMAFLFAVIVLVITEIIRDFRLTILLDMISCGIVFCFPELISIGCVTIYSTVTDDTIKSRIYDGKIEKTNGYKGKEHIVGLIVSLFVVISSMISAYYKHGISGIILNSVLLVISFILGVKSCLNENAEKKYYEIYDSSRLESRYLKKQRREAFERNEEDVYMATLEERNRIAREIHDNVGHMLTRAIVQMQAIKVINDSEVIKPHLESVDNTINQAMLNIRKSVHELHDDSVDMSVVISECMKALPNTIKGELKTSIESAASSELKNTCIAIVREAITNVAKYSKGDKVKVEVIEHAAFWRIKIKDNGVNEKKDYGMYLRDKSASDGMGLIGIYQRATRLGGNVNITSDKDGFVVLVTLPKHN